MPEELARLRDLIYEAEDRFKAAGETWSGAVGCFLYRLGYLLTEDQPWRGTLAEISGFVRFSHTQVKVHLGRAVRCGDALHPGRIGSDAGCRRMFRLTSRIRRN